MFTVTHKIYRVIYINFFLSHKPAIIYSSIRILSVNLIFFSIAVVITKPLTVIHNVSNNFTLIPYALLIFKYPMFYSITLIIVYKNRIFFLKTLIRTTPIISNNIICITKINNIYRNKIYNIQTKMYYI